MHVVSQEMPYKHNSAHRGKSEGKEKGVSAGILITINKASRLTKRRTSLFIKTVPDQDLKSCRLAYFKEKTETLPHSHARYQSLSPRRSGGSRAREEHYELSDSAHHSWAP